MSAQEGLAVHRRVDVGRVGDGLAHQDRAGERWLFEAAQPPVVHLELSGAVQHLYGAAGGANVTLEATDLQSVYGFI